MSIYSDYFDTSIYDSKTSLFESLSIYNHSHCIQYGSEAVNITVFSKTAGLN